MSLPSQPLHGQVPREASSPGNMSPGAAVMGEEETRCLPRVCASRVAPGAPVERYFHRSKAAELLGFVWTYGGWMKGNICTICCRGALSFIPLPRRLAVVLDDVLPSLPSSPGSQGQACLLRNALLPAGASSFGVSSASFFSAGFGVLCSFGVSSPSVLCWYGWSEAPAERGAVEERDEPHVGSR